MKKLTFLFAIAVSTTLANAQKIQEKEVPAKVKTNFQKQFPNAKSVKWEKEKENFEVGFEQNKTKHSVLINSSGGILETEIDIKSNELSPTIKGYIAKNHSGKKIKEAAKITDSKGIVTYEAEVDGHDLIFSDKGSFIKSEKD